MSKPHLPIWAPLIDQKAWFLYSKPARHSGRVPILEIKNGFDIGVTYLPIRGAALSDLITREIEREIFSLSLECLITNWISLFPRHSMVPFDGGGVVWGTRDLALSDLSRVLTVSYVTSQSQSPLTATKAPKASRLVNKTNRLTSTHRDDYRPALRGASFLSLLMSRILHSHR
jgi:hypothetical protein